MAIRINEIYPNPDGGYEWVELYNEGDISINIADIKLYDVTSKNLKFSASTLEPKSFVAATGSAVLNNGGDTIFLEQNGTIIESISYGAIEQNKSNTRCADAWYENTNPTPLSINACYEEEAVSTLIPNKTPSIIHTYEKLDISQSNMASIEPTISMLPKTYSTNAQNVQYFADKHAVKQKISIEPSIAFTQPPTPSTSVTPPVTLYFVGLFSLIQIVFLVYLIFRRIRYQ